MSVDGMKGRLERIDVIASRLQDVGGRAAVMADWLKDLGANVDEMRVIVADALAALGRMQPNSPGGDPVWVPDDPQSPSVDDVDNFEDI